MFSLFLVVCVLLALAAAVIFVFVTSRRFSLPAIPVIMLFTIGFVLSVIVSNLVFSVFIGEPGFILTDNRSILGGGFGWTAVTFTTLLVLRKPIESTDQQESATVGFEASRHGAAWVVWTLIGYGLASIVVASFCASIADLSVFFLYGLVSLQPIPNLLIWIASTVYVLVCVVASCFVFQFLLQRKAKTIKTILYSETTNLTSQYEQGKIPRKTTSNKTLWLSGCLGSIIFVCLLLGAAAGYILYEANQPFLLDGKVSLPSTVKQGDKFDFVITLTNSTTESVFIKHIVLSDSLGAPTILNGAPIVSVEPDMDVEAIYTNSFQYSYFREIKPGETQVVIFHMQAENTGVFYEDVGVYARDPLRSDPAFLNAFQFAGVTIEITP